MFTDPVCRRLRDLRRWTDDEDLLRSARAHANSLKKAYGTLSDYLERLDGLIEETERTLLPFVHWKGLSSLPSNVLQMIFEEVDCLDHWPYTCKSFFILSRCIPRFWKDVSNAMPSLPHLRRALYFGKSTGLDVSFHIGEPDMVANNKPARIRLVDMVPAVLPHCGRWEELNLYISVGPGEDVQTHKSVLWLFSQLMKLNLPRLHTMRYHFSRDSRILLSCNNQTFIGHFYRTLALPNLKKLETVNFITLPFSTPALTSVQIDLRTNFDHVYFVKVLSFLPKLEGLTLHLMSSSAAPATQIQPLTLGTLITLEIKVTTKNISELFPLRRALITPAVRKMRAIIQFNYPSPDVDWMSFFLCNQEYPDLVDLSFEIDINKRDVCRIPLHKAPNLRSLSVHSPYVDVKIDPRMSEMKMPALRTIEVHSDLPSWLEYLKLIRAKLEQQGDSKTLEKITVTRKKWDTGKADKVKGYFENRKVICLEDGRDYFHDRHITEWPRDEAEAEAENRAEVVENEGNGDP